MKPYIYPRSIHLHIQYPIESILYEYINSTLSDRYEQSYITHDHQVGRSIIQKSRHLIAREIQADLYFQILDDPNPRLYVKSYQSSHRIIRRWLHKPELKKLFPTIDASDTNTNALIHSDTNASGIFFCAHSNIDIYIPTILDFIFIDPLDHYNKHIVDALFHPSRFRPGLV